MIAVDKWLYEWVVVVNNKCHYEPAMFVNKTHYNCNQGSLFSKEAKFQDFSRFLK